MGLPDPENTEKVSHRRSDHSKDYMNSLAYSLCSRYPCYSLTTLATLAVQSVRVVYTQGVSINCNCSLFLTISFSLSLDPFFLYNFLFHSVTECLFTLTHSFLLLIRQLLINEIYSLPIRTQLMRAAT